MAITARELISRSFYLSGVVSRGLQTVSGEQLSDGLYLLNALLEFKGSDTRLIAYYQEYELNTVAGTESYFIPNLLEAETVTFNLDSVRFGMVKKSRKQYFGTSRVDNIQSLPFTYHVERKLGGAQLYLYFEPNQVYPIKIWGKFGLTDVDYDTDLTLTYDKFYIEYLRHALANYICADYGINMPDQANANYKELQKKLTEVSPADLTIPKATYFSDRETLNWAVVNLSFGYLPY